ncbi:MAG TPA: hypothetical protein EYP36_05100 [Calditrichaeota bacterium]|nr:hypothetical protein [Calditrichota bacterium]
MVKKKPPHEESVDVFYKLIHHLKTPLSTIRMAVGNIRYLMNEHIIQPDIRLECEDILLDADKSVEDIALTITVIQGLLNQNKQVETVLKLSEIIADFKERIIKEGLSVVINYDEICHPLIRWKGFDLASVLMSLIRYLPRANEASLALDIHCRAREAGEKYVRFQLTLEINSNYAVSNQYFQDNLGLLIAKWILGQQDILLHYSKSAQKTSIYFDIPVQERE